MESVSNFRKAYRVKEISKNYNGYLHFAFIGIWCLTVIILCIIYVDQPTWKELLILPFTFIYTNFIEYIGHKGPMHHRKKYLYKVFERHSLQHHQFFTEDAMSYESVHDFKAVLFPPVLLIFFFVCFVLPVAFIFYWLWSVNAALIFMGTIIAYYLNYELLHFCYHLPKNSIVYKFPFISRLSRLHRTHHNKQLMTKYNFNISYPIFDWIFGTLYKN